MFQKRKKQREGRGTPNSLEKEGALYQTTGATLEKKKKTD